MAGLIDNIKTSWLPTTLFFAILTVSTIFLIKPIYDTDFFWHLKTGEWIWQHRALPDYDPFNFITPSQTSSLISFTLTSYWFSQTLLYLAWLTGGMGGIVAVRFLAAGVILYTTWRRLQGDRTVNLTLLLLFAVMIFNLYLLERPQTVSFVCYGLLLLVIDRIRQDRASVFSEDVASVLLTATVMLIWANSHGGYLVGQATIILILFIEGVKQLHPLLRPLAMERYRTLLLAGSIGIAASLVNPNGYRALQFMLQTRNDNTSTQVQEFSSMPEFFRAEHPTVLLIYFAVMLFVFLLIVFRPLKVDVTDTVLLFFLGVAAFQHIRYAAFFAIAVIPVMGKAISNLPSVLCWGRRLLPICALSLSLFVVNKEASINIATALAGNWVNNKLFPVDAANFIASNKLQGNMFNDYNWGGYLIWRLAPEHRVFADGRNLNTDTLALVYRIVFVQTSDSGEKIWKQLLQKYDINYIVTTSHTRDGDVTPLAEALQTDTNWRLVFAHARSRSSIFVRNIPENAHIVAQIIPI